MCRCCLLGLCAFFAFCIATVAPSIAVDLNAPLDDRPTMASEIFRGWSAATDCALNNFHALQDGECITSAASNAEQSHSNFKPFHLGLFFGEWYHEQLAAQTGHSMTDNMVAQAGAPEHDREAMSAFVVFRHTQRELGVTDDQILAITERDMNDFGKSRLASALKDWEAKSQ